MTFPWLAKILNRDHLFEGEPRMWSKATCFALSLAVILLGWMGPAQAIQDPPGCTGPGVFFGLTKDPAGLIVNNSIVKYTITLQNDPFPACTASISAIQAFCPNANGQSTVPAMITVQNPIPNPLPVPTALFTYGTFECTVNVNPGVTIAQARDTLSGTLNDLVGADDPLSRENTVSNNIVTEGMTVSKICQVINEGTGVNFSGTVTNTGSDTLINLECTDDSGATVELSSTTIPPGGQVTYSGSFPLDNPNGEAVTSTDTVTCIALGEQTEIEVGPESATASCRFTPPPPPAIPTLSGWVMIMLAAFLVLVGATTMLRRKPVA